MDIASIISPLNVLIGGIIGVWLSNRLKKNTDIQTFRYTKLYELNTELNSLPPLNYLSDMEDLVSQTTDRFEKVKDIYYKSLPLLGAEHTEKPKRILEEQESLSNGILDEICGEKDDKAKGVPLKELLLKRQEFERMVREAFFITFAAILK